jgi:hypothetical protein
MKNKIYKYTVISRERQGRQIFPAFFVPGTETVVHHRTNWRWMARLWAWWLKPKLNTILVEGHIKTTKDNQP